MSVANTETRDRLTVPKGDGNNLRYLTMPAVGPQLKAVTDSVGGYEVRFGGLTIPAVTGLPTNDNVAVRTVWLADRCGPDPGAGHTVDDAHTQCGVHEKMPVIDDPQRVRLIPNTYRPQWI